jgi:hypothetical protein
VRFTSRPRLRADRRGGRGNGIRARGREPADVEAAEVGDEHAQEALPAPENAVFGCYAPRAPIQKPHTNPIYIGKR